MMRTEVVGLAAIVWSFFLNFTYSRLGDPVAKPSDLTHGRQPVVQRAVEFPSAYIYRVLPTNH